MNEKTVKNIWGGGSPSTNWTKDNLEVMGRVNSKCIDLIYLDPHFNSNASNSGVHRVNCSQWSIQRHMYP